MTAKKLNLSPEVKSRLRQAVLGGIGSTETPKAKSLLKPSVKPAKPAALPSKPKMKRAIAVVKKTPAKSVKAKVRTVNADIAKIKLATPTVKLATSKPSAKMPLSPALPKTQVIVPPFSVPPQKIKPTGYKPFASPRDWEKPEKEESLEKLFKKNKTPSSGGLKSFFKLPLRQKIKLPRRHLWAKLVGLVVILAILLVGYIILGVYRYGFNDAISSQVAKTLILPAGFVDNLSISVGDYLTDMNLLAMPLSKQREGMIDYSGKIDISDRIFYRLAANRLMEEKLKMYNKPVSQSDLDGQVALLLQQTGGQAEADKIISDLYGLTFAQFKTLVLYPMMERSALQTAIIEDESLMINKTAKDRAIEVLKLAQASTTDFSVLAKQYTDDESGVNTGGDLGWVAKGQLDPSWEELIFGTATGTVVNQPIKSGFGYHIIKVEQKLQNKATGEISVKLRHILIQVDVDQYIKQLLDSARIIKYIK